jgi:hypothetical protein
LSDAAQAIAVPVQVPAWHLSSVVQRLPSLQGVPLGAAGVVHMPVPGLQVPARWHWSGAAQAFAVPVQVPAWHLSSAVQRLPSSQLVPSPATALAHMPVLGSQTPATRH